jgi:hypothetical protein
MNGKQLNNENQFDIGDEVIGDDKFRGVVVEVAGRPSKAREYTVQLEKDGSKVIYVGEISLQLLKKGERRPPRPDLMEQLEADLKTRPLIGLRAG